MKAISKEQIDALQRYDLDNNYSDHWMELEKEGDWVKFEDLRALYDNAPSVAGEPVFAEYFDEENDEWEKIAIKDVRAYNHAMYKTRILYTTPQPDRVAELEVKLTKLVELSKKVEYEYDYTQDDQMTEAVTSMLEFIQTIDQAMKGGSK